MMVLNRIKRFLKTKTTAEIKSFEDELTRRYGLKWYLYATSEGLPIIGNLEGYEELSAKVPELFKVLSELEQSGRYIISGETATYLLVRIVPDVILLAQTSRKLTPVEIYELRERTKKELEL
ncbi:hypothetical protein [Thermococcus sp.]|uniref:hypothetical protein n=1 Tax=Thermococcus sp. TaxID=35749 RepID=UPI00262F07C5|nr:hypothetical protein [Thermococcus sp.]